MLLGEWRHVGPVIVDMAHRVGLEEAPVIWSKETLVPNFDGVGKVRWQLAQKRVEALEKFLRLNSCALELKDEGTSMVLEHLAIGGEHELVEQPGIKEASVRLARLLAVALQRRVLRNGQFLPHLGAHVETWRKLLGVLGELVIRGGAVEGGVQAHSAEQRRSVVLKVGILSKTVLLEAPLGIGLVVDKTLPAFVGPGGRAESNQRRESHIRPACACCERGLFCLGFSSGAIQILGPVSGRMNEDGRRGDLRPPTTRLRIRALRSSTASPPPRIVPPAPVAG